MRAAGVGAATDTTPLDRVPDLSSVGTSSVGGGLASCNSHATGDTFAAVCGAATALVEADGAGSPTPVGAGAMPTAFATSRCRKARRPPSRGALWRAEVPLALSPGLRNPVRRTPAPAPPAPARGGTLRGTRTPDDLPALVAARTMAPPKRRRGAPGPPRQRGRRWAAAASAAALARAAFSASSRANSDKAFPRTSSPNTNETCVIQQTIATTWGIVKMGAALSIMHSAVTHVFNARILEDIVVDRARTMVVAPEPQRIFCGKPAATPVSVTASQATTTARVPNLAPRCAGLHRGTEVDGACGHVVIAIGIGVNTLVAGFTVINIRAL